MSNEITGRFAPSPSGYMHMGNLLAMLLAWLDIRSLGGRLIFRMEDLDPARSRREYEDALAEDLRWLGLDWDEGWPDPAFAQSRRTGLYAAAFDGLRDAGLVYPCFCSRARRLAAASAPHPGEAVSDGGCRCAFLTKEDSEALLRAGRLPAWKLRVPDRSITFTDGHYGAITRNLARDCGDFILRRRDGVYAYQLAVSVDDLRMGVTRVVRGRDLLDSVPRQIFLMETLGGTPPAYCHAPLLLPAPGEGKLSKRLGSLSTQTLRTSTRPEALVGRLAYLCGLLDREEPVTPRELLPHFSWERVSRADIPLTGSSGPGALPPASR